MREYYNQQKGRIVIVDEDLAVYSTRSSSRKEAPLMLALVLALSCSLLWVHALLGLITLFIGLAFLYPYLIKIKVTVQPEGLTKQLMFMDFVINREFASMSEISKVICVKHTGRNGQQSFSVEILHQKGEISIGELADIDACEELEKFIKKFNN